MDSEQDWNAFLRDHPVFSAHSNAAETSKSTQARELSANTLPDFTNANTVADGPAPSGRCQVMVVKDSDLIVAVGNEIRMASLADVKTASQLGSSESKSYKIFHTPNLAFDIHQIALNPNAKFLAVAGAYQVAVVVLPRASSTRLATNLVDCKFINIGQEYHNTALSVPIAKIEWHPWGDGGTTLMVMSVDGFMREYDIAVDTEEPQQTLTFVPERTANAFMADDDAEREVASFTIGKGKADWGPLTMYAIMRSGDIYAICPYMPKNVSIPSSYVHALECFVAAKQEFLLSRSVVGGTPSILATVYDYQHKYVTALLKQLPPGATHTSAPRSVLMHPPNQVKTEPIRQGPFLLQPAPINLDGCDSGDATDIVYLAFGKDEEGNEGETERLGIVLVSYQEGKVDVFLDVEKVEARWERKHQFGELPMLAVYESVDLGLAATLAKADLPAEKSSVLELFRANHPVFLQDPVRDETVYVYHAFGIHALHLSSVLQNLANTLRDDISNDGSEPLGTALDKVGSAVVQPMFTTFSSVRRSSTPVIAVAIPGDVYLTYSIFMLTSAMHARALPLMLQTETETLPGNDLAKSRATGIPASSLQAFDSNEPSAYVSLLTEPFEVPAVLSSPFSPMSGLPRPDGLSGPFELTPIALRYLASIVDRMLAQLHGCVLAQQEADYRATIQAAELSRQENKTKELLQFIQTFQVERKQKTREKLESIQKTQRSLLAREEKILSALMKKASPELSESETKWFQELRRMRAEIKGSSESLSARTAHLRRELNRLLPGLKDLKIQEERLHKQMSSSATGLGVTQASEFGRRSSVDRDRIAGIEKEVQKLAVRLDVTLGRPPSLRPQSEESDEE